MEISDAMRERGTAAVSEVAYFHMEPFNEMGDMEAHIRKVFDETGKDEALVSIVFAPPKSVVLEDLAANFAYFNLRSGLNWNLFFAGYGARNWGRFPVSSRRRKGVDFFNHHSFREIAETLEGQQRAALRKATDVPPGRRVWTYSGRCDLVSLMAYRASSPWANWDWLSLRAVSLTNSAGQYEDFSLAEVVETASRWRQEPWELERFGPGESPAATSVLSLESALTAVTAAVASGVAGNTVYDLLKQLM